MGRARESLPVRILNSVQRFWVFLLLDKVGTVRSIITRVALLGADP